MLLVDTRIARVFPLEVFHLFGYRKVRWTSWNRLNLAGQGILAVALVLAGLRVLSWLAPDWHALAAFNRLALSGSALSYKWVVDVGLAGVIGYGVYFWYSGRAWCRFFCPLAALMHIYARFSRFRILADKKKCISCNVCTSVCHQGIDVMSLRLAGISALFAASVLLVDTRIARVFPLELFHLFGYRKVRWTRSELVVSRRPFDLVAPPRVGVP